MKNTILIVVAHPDDETISMGGTIRKHIDNGDDVYAISMTDGVSSRNNYNKNDLMNRRLAANKSSLELGFKWAKCSSFPDNQMDTIPLLEIIKDIEKIKMKYKPNIVYTHSSADLNIDHRVVSNAVLTAFRPEPKEVCKEIRFFEVVSATDYGNFSVTGLFSPNLYVSINETWDSKLKALNCYYAEIKDYPHTRSIKGIKNLAKLRGNQVGLEMAEAFEVIRKIDT